MGQVVKRRRSSGPSLYGTIGGNLGQYAGGMAGGPVGATVGRLVGAYAGGKVNEAVNTTKHAFSNESTLSTRHSVARKKGKKLGKANRKKTVKVSSLLRKKISKVIEEKKVHGSWTQYSFGFLDRPNSNAQVVQAIQQVGTNDFAGGWQFLPEQFLHCASVLFNGKTDSQANRSLANDGNLGITNPGEGNGAQQQTYGCNAKFHVKSSWESYHLKNNTQQTFKVRMYTVGIKSPESFYSNTLDTPSGIAVGGQFVNMSPINNWINSLATQTGRNVLAADIFRVGMRPESDPNFKKLFNHEVTEIILDPGQTHSCNVAGPCHSDMNYQKYWINQTFQNVQKYSRYTFFIVESDLIQGAGAFNINVGRFKLAGTGTICIERKFHASFSVPESTGTRFGDTAPAGRVIENNQIRHCFAHQVYSPATPDLLQRIDEQQPATIEG